MSSIKRQSIHIKVAEFIGSAKVLRNERKEESTSVLLAEAVIPRVVVVLVLEQTPLLES